MDFILEPACECGIPAKERECLGKDKQDGVPKSEIQQTPEERSRYVINATCVHMQRHTVEDLSELQKELGGIAHATCARGQNEDDPVQGLVTRNQACNKEVMERCFNSQHLPKLQYLESVHKLSKNLTRFLKIGGELHDDFAKTVRIPPGFVYQLWLDKITSYIREFMQRKQMPTECN
jgi:hypothetical protein